MSNSEGQQWAFKGLSFNRCTTGVKSGGTNVVFTSCSFTNCSIGIDATGTGGSVVLLDSTGVNTGTLVSSYGGASIILENIQNDKSNTVSFNGGDPAATFNVPNTWVHGQIVRPSIIFSGPSLTLHSIVLATLTTNGKTARLQTHRGLLPCFKVADTSP